MAAAPPKSEPITTVKVDTEWGEQTIKGLQTFCKNEGADPGSIDGKWGPGSKKALQTVLKKKGHFGSNIDGDFGTKSNLGLQTWLVAEGYPTCKSGAWSWWDTMCVQMYLNAYLNSAPPAKEPPAIAWAKSVLGNKISLSEDDTIATDDAANPRDGDDGKGRYRVVRSDKGFSAASGAGAHIFKVKILTPCRVLIGICTDAVQSDWREGNKKSLHQSEEAWTVCTEPAGAANCGMWHANSKADSGLPAYKVGSTVDVYVDLKNNLLGFKIDGGIPKDGNAVGKNQMNLPEGKTFYPVACFGGDDTKGGSLQLVDYQFKA
mmetsp:Transcript_70320/g.128804  ORF Transcript_70320/g.128804 Transcript_70320/m.128804 type:complete len:319 (+) Transcript_70320:91-1047(+)